MLADFYLYIFYHYYRRAPKGFPEMPVCRHGKKKIFSCEQLTMQDIRRFHQQFYANQTKSGQDSFILKHTEQGLPRRCKKDKRATQVVIKYFIRTKNQSYMRVSLFNLLFSRFHLFVKKHALCLCLTMFLTS